MKKLSMCFRLALGYFVVLVVLQLTFGVGTWLVLRDSLRGAAENSLDHHVQDVRRFLQSQPAGRSAAELHKAAVERFANESTGDYLAFMDAEGNLIYRSSALAQHDLLPLVHGPMQGPAYNETWSGGAPLLFVLEHVDVQEKPFTVLVGIDMRNEQETLERFKSQLLWLAPLLLLGGSMLAYALSRRALAPVKTVARAANMIDGHSLSLRIQTPNTGDELQQLGDSMNEMLGRLEVCVNCTTNFTADASHELRTPIALIRTEAETALRRSRGEAEYRETLRHILLEAERTTSLLEELLALARADAGRQILHVEPLDLRGTLQEVATGWRQVANVRGMQFSERLLNAELRVIGDAAALRRVVDILLDNAFKYTPVSGGAISLSAEEVTGRAIISVQDNGVGIAEHDQGRIFERFYRVNKERSREMGGAGLGLAIAQWVVEQHQGKITVESTLGAGSIFRVELPLAPASVPRELSVR
ncbi:MAG TPA: ATP-binding protein [Terriglobales bacterium]|nr:ATP-binding protein [Terriglobales bacterium]